MTNTTNSFALGAVKLYNEPIVSNEDLQAVANYSKMFGFDLEIENELKRQGVEISKLPLEKEIKLNANVDFQTVDAFEYGYYVKDKASDRLTNLVKSGAVRKDFLSKDCRTAIAIEYLQEMQGIEKDIASVLNPTLEAVNSKILKQDKTFNDIMNKAKQARERYTKNYNTKDKKQLEVLHIQAIEYIN